MTKAVLTLSPESIYDDLPEKQYQFPKTYLNQMQSAVGDWVVYYEPRRNSGPSSSGGRQSYFAIAVVERVRPAPQSANQFYADLSHFLPFYSLVPFKEAGAYFESSLRREDGQTNKGAFGRAVRLIPDHEYAAIVEAGFRRALEEWEIADRRHGVQDERPIMEQLVRRPFRDQAFRKHVRQAYGNTCAVTGLRLLNGGDRPEVQAAHIMPVEKLGPDSVRNGLALTGTVHWLFDRGLISIDDNGCLLVAEKGLPEGTKGLVEQGKPLLLPIAVNDRPHGSFLRWHREHVFHQELC